MKQTISYSVLIHKIRKLYFRVSLITLHKHINRYHKIATHQNHANDIKSPLHECVDIIIGYALDNPKIIYTIGHTMNNSSANPRSRENTDATGQHITVSQEHISDLSKYFKARSRGSDLYPDIKEKLEHSIWDHVHATIRCARIGDKRCSKMHADIADTACKELSHYTDAEDYRAFTEIVEEHLKVLKSDYHNEDS